VPNGLVPDWSRSTIIESPTIKAARLFYKGRLTPDSLAVAFRTTLEANGWRYLSSTTAAEKGTTQVYEKPGSSLQATRAGTTPGGTVSDSGRQQGARPGPLGTRGER